MPVTALANVDSSAEPSAPASQYVHVEDPRLRVALEEAWKAIDVQRDQVGEVKSRAIALLSIATLTVGLFGDRTVLGDDGVSGWAIAVGVGFAVLLVCAVWVSVPRRWRFARRPASLRWYPDNAKTIDEMRSGLLADAVQDFEDHDTVLRQVRFVQTLSVVALGEIAVALMVGAISS
jgi:hypothetical protein